VLNTYDRFNKMCYYSVLITIIINTKYRYRLCISEFRLMRAQGKNRFIRRFNPLGTV